MIYIGIDPGLKGGICGVDKTGNLCILEAMPTISSEIDLIEIERLLSGHTVRHVIMEKAQAMPRQGVSSTFSYGVNFGRILGFLAISRISYTLVSPRIWQKSLFTGVDKRKPKAMALVAARRIWPKEDFLATLRSKVPHDGLVDAALIAEYCRRTLT